MDNNRGSLCLISLVIYMITSFLIFIIDCLLRGINMILPNILIWPQALQDGFNYVASVLIKFNIIFPIDTTIDCIHALLWFLSLFASFIVLSKVIGFARGTNSI